MENRFVTDAGLGRRVPRHTASQRLAVAGLKWLGIVLLGIVAAHWLAGQFLDSIGR